MFKEWFIISRDQVVHSRHYTLVEAALAAAEHQALTGDVVRTHRIRHRGLIPEEGMSVPLGWVETCTEFRTLSKNLDTGEYEECIPTGWHHWLWTSQESNP